jgi:B-Raf proto-oncogene serine/threonine-protein kinase
MYLEEYQELTSKLHELEIKEQELSEKLQQIDSEFESEPLDEQDPHIGQQMHAPNPPQFIEIHEPETESNSGTLTRQPKPFLRAHLPNKQRTSVEVIPGVRLREALAKALKRRNLPFEMCEVTTELDGDASTIIDWDTEISQLRCEEVYVKILDIGFPAQNSHQFIRKTFFSLAFCECCRRLLFTGLYCTTVSSFAYQ